MRGTLFSCGAVANFLLKLLIADSVIVVLRQLYGNLSSFAVVECLNQKFLGQKPLCFPACGLHKRRSLQLSLEGCCSNRCLLVCVSFYGRLQRPWALPGIAATAAADDVEDLLHLGCLALQMTHAHPSAADPLQSQMAARAGVQVMTVN